MNRRVLAAVAASLLMLFSLAAPAAAHERRTVGSYTLVVGWADEPAFTTYKNAVQVRLSHAQTGEPVVDLGEGDLQVEVIHGSKTSDRLVLEPRFRVGAFGDPGDYQADLIPSRSGEYKFHFIGTIKGEKIDEEFVCGEGRFDCPRAPTEVEFPEKDPLRADLEARIDRTADAADGSAKSARMALTVGIAAAVIGVAAFVLALRKRKG